MSDREFTEEDLEHERSHLRSVLTAFLYYKRHALARNQRRRRDYMALSEHHKKLVPDLPAKFDAVDRCVEENMKLLKDVVICAGAFMGLDPLALMAEQYRNQKDRQHPPASPMDMDKVRSTLKQFVRDWSAEGKPERDATYGPIRDELEEMYKNVPIEKRGQIRVLVPGAGLGRLAFDIASQGFSCQGNEYSFYMLLPSNFVLNKMEKEEQYEIYPFIHSYSNIQSSQKQLEPIRIPDVLPSNLPSTCDFSMAAGEFVEVYGEDENNKGAWDVVVTCFFIDTAKNILEYIEVIHGVLKDGGTWINIGPLLYHYEDMPGESSIELDLEQVKRISQAMGFEFEKEKMIQTTYTSNPDSMLQYMYNCAFWKATKKPANKEKE